MADCLVCGEASPDKIHFVREMMLGLRDLHAYHECIHCGSLTLKQPPGDMAKYYPASYYSFNAAATDYGRVARYLRRKRAEYNLSGRGVIGAAMTRLKGRWAHYDWFRIAGVEFDSKILDVGAGSGELVHRFASEGFRSVMGIDPYLKSSVELSSGARVLKSSLEECQGGFDFIYLHHSFEHMHDPLASLRHIHRLLKPGKMAMIAVPVMGMWAWKEYGVDWFQIDAPRHLFIPSPEGMRALAKRGGFDIERVIFDSEDRQFLISDMYRRGESLHDAHGPRDIFSGIAPERLRELRARAADLNARGLGDKACFFLRRIG